jgi:hypothetical protein
MPVGELVFGNIVDSRLFATQGREAPPGVYLVTLPGRALPFVTYRAWKVPTGLVGEEIRLVAPSGRVAYRWGPNPRRMRGSMDLTIEQDLIDDAILAETGTYLASFIIEEEILGEIEVPVFLQEVPRQLPKPVEDGLKRSDVIWVGPSEDGRRPRGRRSRKGVKPWDRPVAPVWFAYRNGKILLLSQRWPGPDEQTVPGLPDARELLVVTRRKGRDTSLDRFWATVRVLPPGTDEYEDAAKVLADRRRSRVGPPGDSIGRWRETCDIAELTPVVPA